MSLENIIWSLEELSDRNEQLKLWLSTGADGAEVSSFAEVVEVLFTDSGLSHELETGWRAERGGRPASPRAPIFDERTDNLFGTLSSLVSRIDVGAPPVDIINDGRMDQVRRLASELLIALEPFRAGGDE